MFSSCQKDIFYLSSIRIKIFPNQSLQFQVIYVLFSWMKQLSLWWGSHLFLIGLYLICMFLDHICFISYLCSSFCCLMWSSSSLRNHWDHAFRSGLKTSRRTADLNWNYNTREVAHGLCNKRQKLNFVLLALECYILKNKQIELEFDLAVIVMLKLVKVVIRFH